MSVSKIPNFGLLSKMLYYATDMQNRGSVIRFYERHVLSVRN